MKKSLIIILTASILLIRFAGVSIAEDFWPPKIGRTFPNIDFVDQNGTTFKMSEIYGSVVLVEYIGMSCPACQAFSGANNVGAYDNINPQNGLDSIKELFPRYTDGLNIDDNRIKFVQVLLYDLSMGQPNREHARNWAEHFGFERYNDDIIVVPKQDLRGRGSYNLIPGFQLLDKNLIVQRDSTGHNPTHNLYKELLPLIKQLL